MNTTEGYFTEQLPLVSDEGVKASTSRCDQVAWSETADSGQGGLHDDRLVHRPVTALRPHPTYLELCGPIAATRVRRLSQQAGAMREPLLITTDGTILDGHVRWQVATERHWSSLSCIEYDLTEEEALQFVIERHRTSEGLNDFCRIRLALRLEPYFREGTYRRQRAGSTNMGASNLTNVDRIDVRADIARVAGVSTGNVTKVKQLLETVIPEIREQLRRGRGEDPSGLAVGPPVREAAARRWRHLGHRVGIPGRTNCSFAGMQPCRYVPSPQR